MIAPRKSPDRGPSPRWRDSVTPTSKWRPALLALALVAVASPAHADTPEPTADPAPAPSTLDGHYLAHDGRLLDPSAIYRRQLDAADPEHVRTILEELFVLGIGTVWYWADRERNLADWDYPSWQQRFTLEAWRFDNNEFPINYLGHPLNGAAFYALPRLNQHGVLVSSAYALATSFAWEFLIEFREKVSVNDLVVTLGAGIPIGEFATKFWTYFGSVPQGASPARRALAATLGFPAWAHREMDDARPVEPPYDDLGFTAAIGRHLEIGTMVRLHHYDRWIATYGGFLGGRLSTIPGEGRPGRFALFFHEADVVSLDLSAAAGPKGREMDLQADTTLLGMYAQEIDRRGDGVACTLGLSLAYDYRFRDLEGYNDRYALLHLPGPAADFAFRSGAVSLTTSYRLNPDFAGLHAAAYPAWRATVPADARDKTILRKNGYYYGWGLSSRFGATLQASAVDLRAAATLGAYDSQEGLDRSQELLTLDPDATDTLLDLQTSLGVTIPSTTLRLALGWSTTRRTSRVESHSLTRTIDTLTATLAAEL